MTKQVDHPAPNGATDTKTYDDYGRHTETVRTDKDGNETEREVGHGGLLGTLGTYDNGPKK